LSIVGQAVAEIHLGRLPEAEAALSAALEKHPEEAELIANAIVLNVLAGKPTEELERYVLLSNLMKTEARLTDVRRCSRLQQVKPSHALLADIQEKSELFDTAASKYAPRVAS
jgi:coatomer protein complex subunit epsilon